MRGRPTTFADDATRALERLGWPCYVAASGDGFGMFASRDLDAGECIMAERPFALTVSISCRHRRCATCLADSRKKSSAAWTIHCQGGCGTQRYCSQRCQDAAAVYLHPPLGVECDSMAKASGDASGHNFEIADVAAQAVRIVAARSAQHGLSLNPRCKEAENGSNTEGDECDPLTFGYDAFASRLVGVAPSTAESRKAARAVSLTVLRSLPEGNRVPPTELRDVLERHACNNFGINGCGGEDIACAAFVGFMQLFNHSCHPNAAFDHATLFAQADMNDGRPPAFSIATLLAIPAHKEICISYLSSPLLISEGTAARKAHLSEYYGFDCSCSRCRDADQGDGLDVDASSAWLKSIQCPYLVEHGCGTGLGVPVSIASDGADGAETCAEIPSMIPSSSGSFATLRCLHCAHRYERGAGRSAITVF